MGRSHGAARVNWRWSDLAQAFEGQGRTGRGAGPILLLERGVDMYEMIGSLGNSRPAGSGLGAFKIYLPTMVVAPFDPRVSGDSAAETAERDARIAEIEARRQRRVAEEEARPAREAAAEQAAIQARSDRQAAKFSIGFAIGGAVVAAGGGFVVYRWLQKRKRNSDET